MKLELVLVALLPLVAKSFSFTSMQLKQQQAASSAVNPSSSSSKLLAIIYGWDGEDGEEESSSSSQPSYYGYASEVGVESCPPDGIAVAESLTTDRDRMGSFARLAVAFSPPERGLNIKDIDQVEVTCVRDNQIELEAMLCEHMGCVSLSVPVLFPNNCDWLDSGCVIQNLDALDTKAESFLISNGMNTPDGGSTSSAADVDQLALLNDPVAAFPNWWVPPAANANLVADCSSIKSLLNEAEFHSEIVYLAQDGMGKDHQDDYRVQHAKVAAVGPAGICLKVAALQKSLPGRGLQFMDVMYPFGEQANDGESLRALVLGAVATAEEKRSP
eukprot:scaffold22639_cov105-Cylindrotheca_fusiformis.AAC.4